MAGREIYDIDPLKREILEKRQARRQMLREQYLEQFHNPYRHATGQGGHVDDIAVNRWSAMKATTGEFFRPTSRNAIWTFMYTVLPFGLAIWATKHFRDKNEKLLRTGQVSYRDRDYKLH